MHANVAMPVQAMVNGTAVDIGSLLIQAVARNGGDSHVVVFHGGDNPSLPESAANAVIYIS